MLAHQLTRSAAKTLALYPKPLAQQRIKDLCSQKQKP